MTPTLPATQSCPPPCHTLDQYAQNTSLFAGDTNISLIFLNGVHNLSNDLIISLANWTNSLLEFQGQGKVPEDTMITLLPSISIDLSDITHLSLVNINVQQHRQPWYPKPTINCSNILYVRIDSTNIKIISNIEHNAYDYEMYILGAQKLLIRNCTFQNAGMNTTNTTDIVIEGTSLDASGLGNGFFSAW